jgi:phage terminase large subunit-like protein
VTGSLAERLAALPRKQLQEAIETLTDDEAAALLYDWKFWARPSQLPPPGDWRVWLILAGRGFGKTRTGAETTIDRVRRSVSKRVGLIAPTAADARDVMVEGESGILACSPPDFRPLYEPSKRRLTWPNGAVATLFSAEEPDRLRGPQHDFIWADEPAAWKYPETWDMAMFGLRLGTNPQVVATTTPRPTRLIRDLVADPETVVTRGTTHENARNLAPAFLTAIVKKYEGTRLGRQELNGEILDDNPGALWSRNVIEALRVREHPPLLRIVVGVDPAATSDPKSDETGIVVAGVDAAGHCYVLADASLQGTPLTWATAVKRVYDQYRADRVVAEKNNGGELVEANLRTVDRTLPYRGVWASRGKQTRAEPISSLYEQGKVHHVGTFPLLEDQMCDWAPDSGDPSPDRMDALVWALTELTQSTTGRVSARSRRRKGT